MIEAAGEIASDTAKSPHVPVLAAEALQALAVSPDGLYLDGTFGAGGLCAADSFEAGGRVLALAPGPHRHRGGSGACRAKAAAGSSSRKLASRRWKQRRAQKELGAFDGIALDIGVSSFQLDEPGAAFLSADGPLDMRMDRIGPTAADLVNTLPEDELADTLLPFRRGAAVAPDRPPWSRRGRRRRSPRPVSWPPSSAASCRPTLGHRSRDPVVPGAAHP